MQSIANYKMHLPNYYAIILTTVNQLKSILLNFNFKLTPQVFAEFNIIIILATK